MSLASLFSNYQFSELISDEFFPENFKHFNEIENLIYSRPLTSLIIGLYNQVLYHNIFFTSYYLKILFILLALVAFKQVLNNLKLYKFDKYLILFIFSISFWVIYIFEIESYSHLASLSIFLILISELNNLDKLKNNNFGYIFYFTIINVALFLVYPELFIVSTIIVFIFMTERLLIIEDKKTYLKIIFFIFIIFLILTLPAYKTNYLFIFKKLNLSMNESKTWWGYFGAFILGKENLVLNQSLVLKIKEYFLSHEILETLKYIFILHINEGYNFFYLNIIPSFFGLYHLSISKIYDIKSFIHLFFVLSITIYLIFII